MSIRIHGCRRGPVCLCGALAMDGFLSCEKCRNRARWMRRKMPRNQS
jgi:hypothetical protein